jgi:magnesium-transporting ATPase (P-type)
MDTLAALALATEKPRPSIIATPPIKKGDNILTPVVWRQIYGMTLYIVIVITFFTVFGKLIFDYDYERYTPRFESVDIPDNKTVTATNTTDIATNITVMAANITEAAVEVAKTTATDKVKHFTFLFNAFVFMHIFNEINCRKVGATSFNIFAGILNNWLFLAVLSSVVALQYCFVSFKTVARIFDATTLDSSKFAECVVLGMTTWVISALLKMTPVAWLKKLPIKIDENKKNDSDPLMSAYNSKAKGKVLAKKDSPKV